MNVLETWQWKRCFDIRAWIDRPNHHGYSQKGIKIPVEKVMELLQAIKEELES